jgi:hypothetical protein
MVHHLIAGRPQAAPSQPTRRTSRIWKRALVAGSLGIAVVGIIGTGSTHANGAESLRSVHPHLPASTPGTLSSVAAVPGSTELFVTGAVGSGVDNDTFFVGRSLAGKWARLPAVNVGGRYGSLNVLDASGPASVWLGGALEQAKSIQDFPEIWHYVGGKFVRAALPALYAGACSVTSISASSATNVWAAGAISPANNGSLEMLHYNGRAWSTVAYPFQDDQAAVSVSTSGPDNAWATDGTNLFHWNGAAWSIDGTAPSGDGLEQVVVDGPTLAYAVGKNDTTYAPVILKYNGVSWTAMPLAKTVPHTMIIEGITAVGSSLWAFGERQVAPYEPDILHSTGGAWGIQSSPGTTVQLTSIDAVSPSRVFAAGYVHTDPLTTYVDSFNGRSWAGISSKL